MKQSLWSRILEILKRKLWSRRWQRAVTCLAAVVVFATTYALILPAITMTDERPTLEAEETVAWSGDELTVKVTAGTEDGNVQEGEEPVTYVLTAEGEGADLSGAYVFNEEGICVITDEAGGKIELHRTLREENGQVQEGIVDYWFTLEAGKKTSFTLELADAVDDARFAKTVKAVKEAAAEKSAEKAADAAGTASASDAEKAEAAAQAAGTAVTAGTEEAATEKASPSNAETIIVETEEAEAAESVITVVSEAEAETEGEAPATASASDAVSVVSAGPVSTASGSNADIAAASVTITGRLPEGAEAVIKPVTLTKEQMNAYFGESAVRGMQEYVFYDISILVNDEEWQPDEGVSVVIRNPAITVPEEADAEEVSMVHFQDKKQTVEKVESTTTESGEIAFKAEGFSLYGFFTYTVDFYYSGREYHMPGNTEMLLSELFLKLD